MTSPHFFTFTSSALAANVMRRSAQNRKSGEILGELSVGQACESAHNPLVQTQSIYIYIYIYLFIYLFICTIYYICCLYNSIFNIYRHHDREVHISIIFTTSRTLRRQHLSLQPRATQRTHLEPPTCHTPAPSGRANKLSSQAPSVQHLTDLASPMPRAKGKGNAAVRD